MKKPTPPTVNDVLNRLRAFRRAMDWNPQQLADGAGLSRETVRNMDAADWRPTTLTIRAIEALIPPTWRAGDPAPDSKEAA